MSEPRRPVSLLDLLSAKSKPASTPVQRSAPSSSVPRLTTTTTTTTTTTSTTRRTRVSAFKRKILAERAARLLPSSLSSSSSSSCSTSLDTRTVLCLKHFVPLDCDDAEELLEVAADARQLLMAFGVDRVELLCPHALVFFPHTLVSDPPIAVLACAALHGLRLGGENLDCIAITPTTAEAAKSDLAVLTENHEQTRPMESKSEQWCLRLRRLVCAEDVVDPEEACEVLLDLCRLADPLGVSVRVWIEPCSHPLPNLHACMCAQQPSTSVLVHLEDVSSLSAALCTLEQLGSLSLVTDSSALPFTSDTLCEIRLCSYVDSSQTEDPDEATELLEDLVGMCPSLELGQLSFEELDGGRSDVVANVCLTVGALALSALAGRTVGGEAIQLRLMIQQYEVYDTQRLALHLLLHHVSVSVVMAALSETGVIVSRVLRTHLPSMLCSPQLAHQQEPPEQEPEQLAACVSFASSAAAATALLLTDGRIVGGQALLGEMSRIQAIVPCPSAEPPSRHENKRPPKLPRRDTSHLLLLGVPASSPEIDLAVTHMLAALHRYQERLKSENPARAKLRPRFYMGMKQAMTAAKLNKLKLLLLASDGFEASEAVDEKMSSLLGLCAAKGVLVLSCLNRRKLGKAAGTSMRQAVVAVIDPNGVYDKYKAIASFVRDFYASASQSKGNDSAEPCT